MEIPAPTATATLESLPDDARIWVYPTDRDLTSAEQALIIERFRPFLDDWKSHGRQVIGAVAVLFGRFIIVAATLKHGDISGCGIDASVRVLNPLAADLGFDICGPLDVHYRAESGSIVSVDRLAFSRAAKHGLVDGSTVVYNTSLQILGELRTRGLERIARDSWHGRAFALS